jgi:tetratricopeptide (TPR) repeat protein
MQAETKMTAKKATTTKGKKKKKNGTTKKKKENGTTKKKKKENGTKKKNTAAAAARRPEVHHPAMLEPLLRGAEQQVAAKQYRRARLAYENALGISPACRPALAGLAGIAARNDQHGVVVDVLLGSRLPAARRPADLGDLSTFGWADGSETLLELLGDALFGLGQLRSALRAYDEAVQVSLKARRPGETEAAANKRQDPRKIKMADVLYAGGQIGSAITVIQDVLSRGENDHPRALAAYARAAADQDKRQAAIEITMKALVLRTDDKKIRAQLSQLVRGADNVALLLSIFAHAATGSEAADGTASALAFLATVVKDYGCVDECVTIYERATALAPGSASYALNLMHAYELRLDYGKCLAHALTFAENNSGVCVGRGGKTKKRKEKKKEKKKGSAETAPLEASCATLARVLRSAGAFTASDKPYLRHPGNVGAAPTPSTAESKQTEQPPPPPPLRVIWEPDEHPGAVVVAATATDKDIAAARQESVQRANRNNKNDPLSEDDLDLLAVFFTVVKVMFVSGRLGGRAMAELVSAVETVRRGREMHTTTVRNEHAYYCCIAQLMSVPDELAVPPQKSSSSGGGGATRQGEVEAGAGAEGEGEGEKEETAANAGGPATTTGKPLVVCGDSHSLTSAWRWVSVKGERRQIHPALVTGLKAWHLREESVFYPKVNFENTVACIPDGSDVVFLFCEIDCREGILMAVEKDRYADFDAGVRRSVGIYVRTLLNLVRTRGFAVYVHPVPPVLDPTRGMVMRFNTVLQEEVRKTEGILKWLDFAEDLVQGDPAVPGKFALRDGLALDGTHMSPAYLPSLARALGAW